MSHTNTKQKLPFYIKISLVGWLGSEHVYCFSDVKVLSSNPNGIMEILKNFLKIPFDT